MSTDTEDALARLCERQTAEIQRLKTSAKDLLAAAKFAAKAVDFLGELVQEADLGALGCKYLDAAKALRDAIATAEGQ